MKWTEYSNARLIQNISGISLQPLARAYQKNKLKLREPNEDNL